MSAEVLIVGVGAIGGPVTLALTSAGFHVRFCDVDAVELSNLQRQVQFTAGDLGHRKVTALASRLAARGVPAGHIDAREQRFDAETAADLLSGVALVIDGSDNFATKFAVNDAAVARGIPSIIASAVATSGQIFVTRPGGACYRCLFEAPPGSDRGNCAQVGVLAPIPGIVAGHTATVARRILGGGTASERPLAVLDHRATTPRWIDLARRDDCPAHRQSASTSPASMARGQQPH